MRMRNDRTSSAATASARVEPLEAKCLLSASFRGLGGAPDPPAGAGLLSLPAGISADGSTVYGSAPARTDGGTRSWPVLFRWTASEGLTLPAGVDHVFPFSGAVTDPASFAVHDVSDDGSVAIGSVSNGTSGPGERSEAFRWSQRDGLAFITPLTSAALAGDASTGSGTSAGGSTVVGTRWDVREATAMVPGSQRVFRWTEAGGVQDLPGLPGASPAESFISGVWRAVSDDGSVIVGRARSAARNWHAFRWTAEGGTVSLGDLPGGRVDSHSTAVSADGAVVVGDSESAAGIQAFRWTRDGGMVGLGDLPGGEFGSVTHAVSADGSVVVGLSFSGAGTQVFRWTQAGGMQALGDLPGGTVGSNFGDMSADGSVVVGRSNSERGSEPFVWDARNGMRSVESVLAEAGVNLGGWSLADVRLQDNTLPPLKVSSDGTTIVGTGRNPDGVLEGWVATIAGPVPPVATIVARHVFYNRSAFDGSDGAANASDDGAIATDKNALLAGQRRLPGFDNVTSFDKGINGVMVDVENLPEAPGDPLTAADFEFGGALRPVSVTVRRGAGAGGSDRVTLTWTDYSPGQETATMATANGWLVVTVRANERTGLARPDVFSFGNLIGEAGDENTPPFRVSALDLAAVKQALFRPASITTPTDFNRDGATNALDVAAVKRALSRSLPLPPPLAAFADGAAPGARRVAEEVGLVS